MDYAEESSSKEALARLVAFQSLRAADFQAVLKASGPTPRAGEHGARTWALAGVAGSHRSEILGRVGLTRLDSESCTMHVCIYFAELQAGPTLGNL